MFFLRVWSFAGWTYARDPDAPCWDGDARQGLEGNSHISVRSKTLQRKNYSALKSANSVHLPHANQDLGKEKKNEPLMCWDDNRVHPLFVFFGGVCFFVPVPLLHFAFELFFGGSLTL